MKKYMLIMFIMVLAISACSAQSTEQSTHEPSISLVGAWKLTSYGPTGSLVPVVEDTEAGLTFNDDGTVAGTSGCNGFGGNYTVESDQVTFSEIVSTLMACDEPLMSQEEAVLKVMADSAGYHIDGNALTLTGDGMMLMLSR